MYNIPHGGKKVRHKKGKIRNERERNEKEVKKEKEGKKEKRQLAWQ